MLMLFSIAIFLGAALLFLVQPMSAREMLPVLGGGPSVWTTCMVFFQCTLLAGYFYAHVVMWRLRPGAQVVPHALVLTGAVAVSILAGRPAGAPGSGAWPVPWLIGSLGVSVGAGFFVLASASPVLQAWFARSGHARSANPYFLYAASNAGSLAGLLAYPFVLEPTSTLADQRLGWTVGLGAFAVLAIACGVIMARRARHAQDTDAGERTPTSESSDERDDAPVTWRTRGRWVFLAFVPSSLMLGVTSYLTSDIAVFPLLWVIPLAIYLASFMVAFSRWGARLMGVLRPAALVAMITLVVVYAAGSRSYQLPSWGLLSVHLAGFAIIATWLHTELVRSAPRAERLTEFYLLLSVGGALGGVFNALVAPQVFLIPVEYALVVAAAGAARAWSPGGLWKGRSGRWALLVLPAVFAAVAYGAGEALELFAEVPRAVEVGVLISIPAAFALLASRHGMVLAMVLAITSAVTATSMITREGVIYFERSFFGTMRVLAAESRGNRYHALHHGSTIHGTQILSDEPIIRTRPMAYYAPEGPAGDVFEALSAQHPSWRAAVVGLGAGALATYTRPGDDMVFYEIDPAMARLARDPALFTYLDEARGDISIVIGDGRRMLADAGPSERYDLIVLDAFSSDAVPVHLLTREAVQVYFDKLKPGGVVLVHISNRYIDLVPVIRGAARALDATAIVQQHEPTARELDLGAMTSTWAVLVPPGTTPLPGLNKGWVVPDDAMGEALWTDDYSDIVSLIMWGD